MKPELRMELQNRIAMARRFSTNIDAEGLGPPSGYICPDCNGSLITVTDGNFRRRVGHAWTADAWLRARDDEIENALWIAIRSLQKKAKLARRLSEQVGAGIMSERYSTLADEAEHAREVLGARMSEVYSAHEDSDD